MFLYRYIFYLKQLDLQSQSVWYLYGGKKGQISSDVNSGSLYCVVNQAFILAEEGHTEMLHINTHMGGLNGFHS